MKATTLFNCCTDHKAPDWSQYRQLELGASKLEGTGHYYQGEEDNNSIGGLAFDDPSVEFFTVYGRTRDGDAEAITDIGRDDEGNWGPPNTLPLVVAAHLQAISGLPFLLYQGAVIEF